MAQNRHEWVVYINQTISTIPKWFVGLLFGCPHWREIDPKMKQHPQLLRDLREVSCNNTGCRRPVPPPASEPIQLFVSPTQPGYSKSAIRTGAGKACQMNGLLLLHLKPHKRRRKTWKNSAQRVGKAGGHLNFGNPTAWAGRALDVFAGIQQRLFPAVHGHVSQWIQHLHLTSGPAFLSAAPREGAGGSHHLAAQPGSYLLPGLAATH